MKLERGLMSGWPVLTIQGGSFEEVNEDCSWYVDGVDFVNEEVQKAGALIGRSVWGEGFKRLE